MTVLALTLCGLLFPDPPQPPKADRPAKLTIVANERWKGTDTPARGWEKPDFDDSKWDKAYFERKPGEGFGTYRIDVVFGTPTDAGLAWAGLAEECYLRNTFEAPRGFRRAELMLLADDVAEVYLNGEKVAEYDSRTAYQWGTKGCAILVDLVPYMREGKNTVAVKGVNRFGPRGVALDIRVDDTPFLKPLEKPTAAALPKDVEKEFDALIGKFNDNSLKVRDEAMQKILDLIDKHGLALKDKIDALKKDESVGVKKRYPELVEALKKKTPAEDPDNEPNDNLRFPEPSLALLRDLMERPNSHDVVTLRGLVPARGLLKTDEAKVVDALRSALKDAETAPQRERAVRYINALEVKDLAPDLAKLIQDKPNTVAAALAASALGKMKARDQKKVLEAAAKSEFAPTGTAARHALRLIDE